MIKVTIMVWFDDDKGEPRYREIETFMYSGDCQWAAEQYAAVNKNGSCKIFDSAGRVVGSAGFE